MSSNADFPAVIANIAGKPLRLVTTKQWRSVIRNKQIERDTVITYEAGEARSEALPAGQCELLVPIFEEILGPEPEPVAPPPAPVPEPEPEPGPTKSPERDPERKAQPKTTPPIELVPEPEPEPNPAPPSPPPPEPPPPGNPWKIPGLIAIVVVVSMFLAFMFDLSRSNDSRFYAKSNITVRSGASASSIELGQLTRNDDVAGVVSEDNPNWIRIVEGQYTGGFVSRKYVSEERRDPLRSDLFDEYITVNASFVYPRPNTNSASVETLPKFSRVYVTGSYTNDFAEVVRNDLSEPIGYVPWAAFGGENAQSRGRPLRVRNRCRTTRNIAFSVEVDGVRKNGDYWVLRGGHDNYISLKPGAPMNVTSSHIFYEDLGSSFHTKRSRAVSASGKDHVNVNGQRRKMTLVAPDMNYNEYIVTFSC